MWQQRTHLLIITGTGLPNNQTSKRNMRIQSRAGWCVVVLCLVPVGIASKTQSMHPEGVSDAELTVHQH
jgi:hypothetical protein